jgi:hypothetical protein
MTHFTRTTVLSAVLVLMPLASRAADAPAAAPLELQAALIHTKAVDYCAKGPADDRSACENDFIGAASQLFATHREILPAGMSAGDYAAAVADRARRRLPAADRLAAPVPTDHPDSSQDPSQDPAAQMVGLSRVCEKLYPDTAARANAQRFAALQEQSPEIHRQAVALAADRSVAARRRIHAAETQFAWDAQIAQLVCTLP